MYKKGIPSVLHVAVYSEIHVLSDSSMLRFVLLMCSLMKESEQAHIPHAPTLLENAVYNEWQFQA